MCNYSAEQTSRPAQKDEVLVLKQHGSTRVFMGGHWFDRMPVCVNEHCGLLVDVTPVRLFTIFGRTFTLPLLSRVLPLRRMYKRARYEANVYKGSSSEQDGLRYLNEYGEPENFVTFKDLDKHLRVVMVFVQGGEPIWPYPYEDRVRTETFSNDQVADEEFVQL